MMVYCLMAYLVCSDTKCTLPVQSYQPVLPHTKQVVFDTKTPALVAFSHEVYRTQKECLKIGDFYKNIKLKHVHYEITCFSISIYEESCAQ